jgi:moderate conductance mechanosensitive channel
VIQAPTQADSPALRTRFSWSDLGWDVVLQSLGKTLLVVVVSFVAYRLVKLLVRRIVSHEIDAEDPIVKRLREQRAQTLGGLLNNVALVLIVTFASLTILNLFVQIGPLLAGVGVAGLAISFGAQSLVKDVISGTFILIEGQFGIGDVVRIGDTDGLVEKITLRTTSLRDGEGVVHIIPNGEITKVSNLTKTWSRSVIDVGVAYREDVDRVIRVLIAIGNEFHMDAVWGELLLDPPEVLGVQALGDSAVVVRMQAKTLPLKQWEVGRELRRRIKNRFDAENIEIPFPHVKVYWGEKQAPSDLSYDASGAQPASR